MFAALNALADPILDALRTLAPLDALLSVGGISAIVWFALFAALRIGFDPGREAFSRHDAPIFVAVIGCALFPAAWTAAIGVFLAGGYLLLTSQPGRGRRVGLVLVSLSGPLIWGKIVLTLLAPFVLGIDGGLVGMFAGTSAHGNLVGFVGGGSFIVGTPCSSLHNISLALVLWSCVIALLDLRIDLRVVIAALAAIVAMFAINIARLTAIALFPAHFDWLHLGTGATLFGWAGLLAAALIVGAGAFDALNRQR